jgi:hypothetical protein
LTYNDSLSYTNWYNNGWAVAAWGDTVHAVWFDKRNGNNTDIHYKRSTDGGNLWGLDARLTSNIPWAENASIAVSGQYLHIVFSDYDQGVRQVFYKRSTNGGDSWAQDTVLGNGDQPSVAVSGSNVSVVWKSGLNKIYWERSVDNGDSWQPAAQLTTYDEHLPSVAVLGSNVHIVWQGHWTNQTFDLPGIYYKQFDAATGDSITPSILLSDPSEDDCPSCCGGVDPCVAASELGLVHVVWKTDKVNANDIHYRRSIDGGFNWYELPKKIAAVTQTWLNLGHPSIAASGSKVHLVYQFTSTPQPGVTNDSIFYQRSLDRGTTWGWIANLTPSDTVCINPSVALSDSGVHVVWSDKRDGNWEIYYRHNPSGNEIYFPGFLTDSSSGRHLGRETWFGSQNLHLVMRNNSNDLIYYARTTNGWDEWSVPRLIETPTTWPAWGLYPSLGLVELPMDVYPPWYAVCVAVKPLHTADSLSFWEYNPSSNVWEYWGFPSGANPGPPSLVTDGYTYVYVGYRRGDGRVCCINFSYSDPGSWTPEVIDDNIDCSQVSLGIDAYGRPHASWRRGTGSASRIWYSWRDVGGWTTPEQRSFQESQQPFAEGFANYMYVVSSEGSPSASEILKREKDLTSGNWRQVQVPTNNKPSESPVQALGEFTVWSDGTTNPGDYNDIYYWRESGNPTIVESNPNEWSYWPHSVMWEDWFGFKHLEAAWTESPNAGQPPYRVLAEHLSFSIFGGGGGAGPGAGLEEIGGYYKVQVGQDVPSPYCRKRDGVMRFGEKAVDYANDSLVYELGYLDPKYDFLVKVSSYRETGNDWVQTLSVDGKAFRTLRFAPNKVDTAWLQIPPELYLKDRKVVFSLKNVKGSYVTALGLGLYYYDHKQRGKGGGPQVGVPVALPVREVFAVYPNPAKGQAQIEYSLKVPGRVDLSVYDLTGRLVRKVVEASQPAGVYKVAWDGRDLGGRAVSSGVYFLKLTAPGKAKTARVVLVR